MDFDAAIENLFKAVDIAVVLSIMGIAQTIKVAGALFAKYLGK